MFASFDEFRKPDAAMDREIDALIAKMTLEEKIDMLGGSQNSKADDGNTVPCRRVGIPSFRMADASVGVHWWTDKSCTFPASIALAASFDPELGERYGRAVGRECRARGIHILLGPGVNLYRSPLCGRNFEYLGEDPWLASRMVTGYVIGLQSQGVAATVKHFAVNFQEYERHKVSSDVDERTLREVYLPAFEYAVKEGGAAAIMTAYNLVNGLHCSEHQHLLSDILKGEWQFDGLVMSDWMATYDALNSANAGLDLEMPTARWMNRTQLMPAVRDGRLNESVIDDKIRRLLRLAFAFGWMDRPQQDRSIPERDERSAALALEVARESMVLLKNDGVLPLDFSKYRKVALIGTTSHPAVISGGGAAFNLPWRSVSIRDGVVAAAGASEVVHVRGVDPWHAENCFQSARYRTPSGEPGLIAEYYSTNDLSGPAALVRTEPNIDHVWRERPIAEGAVGKACFSIRWRAVLPISESGEHVFHVRSWDGAFRVVLDGEVLFDCWSAEVLGDRQLRKVLPSGDHELAVEFRNVREYNEFRVGYEHVDAMTAEYAVAVAAAKDAELVIFCGGHTDKSETEGADRTFGMYPEIEKLLLDVLAVNRNTVVILTGGGNIDMNAWHDAARAIVMAWYPGQEGGTAVADVLTGRVNPSGRLPASFEYRLEDRSSHGSYHDDDGDGRVALTDGVFGGYRHHDRRQTRPRYAFGYGLGYTTFSYENFALSHASLSEAELLAGARVEVSFDIVNTGKVAGKEVAQVYVGDDVSSVVRPVKELKGFAKVEVAAGERERVTVSLDQRAFAFWSLDAHRWTVEKGTFAIAIAASAEDVKQRLTFEVT
ncbi:MAG TPA: glycoside hydrolase family 3 C-terminal domain-containing protein [Polyangiaceae bacterium]|nr:glycoside hydrolase family 3 C-terminal domain-containing protein [Polyangiaceae bacterium]